MKAITKYEAIDGSQFDSEQEALRRDLLEARLRNLEAPLGGRVKTGGRKEHGPEVFRSFKIALVELVRELHPDLLPSLADPLRVSPFSYTGRYIDDMGPDPLRLRWQRLMCMTADGVEYDQPYFALHPGEWRPTE